MSNKEIISNSLKNDYEVNNYEKEDSLGINILKLQEKDRQRIARELHDSSVQSLTGMLHKLELCTMLIDKDSIKAKLELTAMIDTLRSVINEIRDIIYDLKPMSLDDLGLTLSVKRLAEQISSAVNVKINVYHNNEIYVNSSLISTTIFRVIQEACINSVKHSGAKVININLEYDETYIAVSVTDDGIGFDIEEQYKKDINSTSGFGLSIMKERINLLNGTFTINSTRDKGTSIDIRVPSNSAQGGRNVE